MFIQGVKTGILLLLKNSKVSKAFIYTQDLCLVFVHIGCAVDGDRVRLRGHCHTTELIICLSCRMVVLSCVLDNNDKTELLCCPLFYSFFTALHFIKGPIPNWKCARY